MLQLAVSRQIDDRMRDDKPKSKRYKTRQSKEEENDAIDFRIDDQRAKQDPLLFIGCSNRSMHNNAEAYHIPVFPHHKHATHLN